ncbi:DsbA family oxidoreductase [Streptomyces showdoensis]|uniref:Dithiol-disulfide isomerase n=1 Tax=Streptomyces showdoensis TaxID=68268 RepID=A0A2P2GUE1_STREW|nr:DsbA family protein [Streptomyces showdoensis]KKZ74525.1 dithiol-disulfide isomerase [Streptomyces showdoensis]
MPDRPVTLTLWSDLSCPWATLALHTLHAEAERLDVELLVDHRAFPLELFNRMATPKHIIDSEIVAIGGRLPELGWRLWHAPDATYPVTMLPAMEAVQAAKDPAVGGLAGSDQLDTALRRAFLVESRCVSIPAVVLEAADTCPLVDTDALARAIAEGRGRAEVYRDWEEARRTSVQGSPTLFGADATPLHNPGARYHWSKDVPPPEGGFPVLEEYSRDWAAALLGVQG